MKENIACGDGKSAFTVARRKCCSKSQCVEMAAMIRYEHKWSVRRKLLPAHDRESMCDSEVNSQQ